MKRFLCVLLVALALVGLMTTVASAEEYAMVTSENGYGVRMREGPSKAYRVVTKYDVGTTVIVQQRGTEWSQIRVGETVGWMMNEFLVFGTSGTGTRKNAPTAISALKIPQSTSSCARKPFLVVVIVNPSVSKVWLYYSGGARYCKPIFRTSLQ